MKKFILDSWNEYLYFLDKYLPKEVTEKFKKNKKKIITLIIGIAIIEALIITYTFTNTTSEKQNSITQEQGDSNG